jgi:hypothetical protein
MLLAQAIKHTLPSKVEKPQDAGHRLLPEHK